MVAPSACSDRLFGKSAHEEGDEVRQSLILDVASTCGSPPPKTVLRNIKNVNIYIILYIYLYSRRQVSSSRR
jgi:hypothetical protein